MAKLPLDSSYEAIPPASESKGSLGAQRIRETRENARYPQQTEANVGSVASGYTNDGRHSMGSARAFVKSAAPTTLLKPDDTTALTTAEMPSGTLATGAAISASLGPTDTGRIWVDTSGITTRLHYWDGTGWVGQGVTFNGFVNGGAQVWQRSPSAATEVVTSGVKTYWCDQFYTIPTTGNAAITRETATLPTGAVSTVGIKVIGAAATTVVRHGQRIEGWRAKALGAAQSTVKVTLSCKVRNTGANALTATLTVDAATVADNFAAVTNIVSVASKINALAAGSSTTVTHTFSIGTAVSANCINGLDCYFTTSSPNPFPATESYVTTDWQLEIGSTATKPQTKNFDEDLADCVQFYQKTFAYSVKPVTNGGLTDSIQTISHNSNDGAVNWDHLAGMRAVPTITTFNPSAANALWRIVTPTPGDSVAPTVTAGSKRTILQYLSGTINRVIAIHATAEAVL